MPEKLISEQQLSEVLQFSQMLYTLDKYGLYTPYMSNTLLQNLNNNSKIPTLKKIKEALADYRNNAPDLQSYTEFMNNFDMIFKRTLYSYANVLAFDLTVVCTNAYTQDDYRSPQYLEDKRRIMEFLDKFDYKKEFYQVVVELMTRETYFTWFRKTKWRNKGMKLALQIMPQDYCLLTGYWEKGLLYDFDMNYFLQPGVDIEGFDPSFQKKYARMFGGKPIGNYRPTNALNDRTGTFAYWTQTSPEDGAWVFKRNPNNFNSTPFLAPFLKDALTNDEVAQLQMNKDMASAYGILAGEIRLFEGTAGQKANQFAIDPATIQVYMNRVKSALGDTVKAAAMPTENTKFFQYTDNNKDMYTTQLGTSAGVGSGISRVIYSSDRMSNAEIEAGITDQYNTMRPLYSQFNNFMDFFANKLTKHYKFKFLFDGCSYGFERSQRVERLTKFADKGIVLGPSAWASAYGIAPQDFERLLDEAKYGEFSDKWQLMLNTNTSSFGEGGRPRQEGNVNDSTAASREMNDGLE